MQKVPLQKRPLQKGPREKGPWQKGPWQEGPYLKKGPSPQRRKGYYGLLKFVLKDPPSPLQIKSNHTDPEVYACDKMYGNCSNYRLYGMSCILVNF